MEYTYDVKIPKDRVAVLIGTKGITKRKLEKSGIKLDVDSREGDVFIESDDSIIGFRMKDVVVAIGRGFNPETALKLLKDNYVLEMINILDYVKERKNQMERVRGRLIGTDGKCRETIENLSNTYICIYGKTVSIIGPAGNADLARHACESILSGAPHGPVYKHLEIGAAEMKKANMQ